jgi:hypothetical protein
LSSEREDREGSVRERWEVKDEEGGLSLRRVPERLVKSGLKNEGRPVIKLRTSRKLLEFFERFLYQSWNLQPELEYPPSRRRLLPHFQLEESRAYSSH